MANNKLKNQNLILIGAITIIAGISFIVSAAKAQNLPNYDQVIKSLPASVGNFVNTVKQTVGGSQTPSAQNVNLSSQGILTEITSALNWLDKQFKDLTGISFSYLWATVVNFLVWLIKLVIGLVQEIIILVTALSKK